MVEIIVQQKCSYLIHISYICLKILSKKWIMISDYVKLRIKERKSRNKEYLKNNLVLLLYSTQRKTIVNRNLLSRDVPNCGAQPKIK